MRDLQAKIVPSLTHQSFEVSKHFDYFMLKFSDGELFAQISELACRGLAELQELPSVEIVAFAETKRIQRVFARTKKPGEATLKVEGNVYGSADDTKVVGDKLCSVKMFLQDPDHGTKQRVLQPPRYTISWHRGTSPDEHRQAFCWKPS